MLPQPKAILLNGMRNSKNLVKKPGSLKKEKEEASPTPDSPPSTAPSVSSGSGGMEAENHHDELRKKAQSALRALMPFMDKFPQETLFSDTITNRTSTPRFHSFCEERKGELAQFLPPSEVIDLVSEFDLTEPKPNPNFLVDNEKEKASFKRPPSPSSNHSDKKNKKSKQEASQFTQPSDTEKFGGTKEEMQARLREKLDQFRAKRKNFYSAEESAEARKLQKKLRRVKKKMQSREKKLKPKKETAAVNGMASGHVSAPGSATPSSHRSSSIVSEEGRMIYSKFDFFEPNNHHGNSPANLHPKQPRGKNLTHLLNKAESEKKKMADLEGSDEATALALKKKQSWQEALLKAQGVKLKNDPVKLKKAIKEEKKRKERSKKTWQARKGHEKKGQRDKQEKRTKNLEARKEKTKNKKRKKAIKKGHVIPGFN